MTKAEIDAHQLELFRSINGFSDADVERLRRYCLRLDERVK
jgi:hypothetical protein